MRLWHIRHKDDGDQRDIRAGDLMRDHDAQPLQHLVARVSINWALAWCRGAMAHITGVRRVARGCAGVTCLQCLVARARKGAP